MTDDMDRIAAWVRENYSERTVELLMSGVPHVYAKREQADHWTWYHWPEGADGPVLMTEGPDESQ